MLVIRTAEDLARALALSLEPVVKERLAAHRDHLLDYPDYAFEELGLFIIVQPDDHLDDLNGVTSAALTAGALFAVEPERVARHDDWLEVLFIVSDDGFGVVLFVPLKEELDSTLLDACQKLASSLDLSVQPKASTK